MSEQKSVSHKHDYYVELVKSAPKADPHTSTAEELKQDRLYGNNFYTLFIALSEAKKAPDPQRFRKESLYAKLRLIPAETMYPTQWPQFLSHNIDLIQKIGNALGDVKNYMEASVYHTSLFIEARKNNDYSKLHGFEALGLDAMALHVHREFNPLLKEAAGKMEEEGIIPEDFFG